MGFSSATNWCVRVFGLDSPRSRAWNKDLKTAYLEDDSRKSSERRRQGVYYGQQGFSLAGDLKGTVRNTVLFPNDRPWGFYLLILLPHGLWTTLKKGVNFLKFLLLVTLEEDSKQKNIEWEQSTQLWLKAEIDKGVLHHEIEFKAHQQILILCMLNLILKTHLYESALEVAGSLP